MEKSKENKKTVKAVDKNKVAKEKAKEIEEMREVKVEKKKAAKNNHKYESAKVQTEEQKEMTRFFIVLLIVVLMVTCIYFLTRIFVTKDLGKKNNTTDTEEVIEGSVNYNVASVGQILNRPYDTYYVMVYDAGGEYAYDVSTILSMYSLNEKAKHVYRVDLSNHLNKEFYDKENENVNATSVDEFKFGDITLLYIKKGKVAKYITDLSKIKTELGVN